MYWRPKSLALFCIELSQTNEKIHKRDQLFKESSFPDLGALRSSCHLCVLVCLFAWVLLISFLDMVYTTIPTLTPFNQRGICRGRKVLYGILSTDSPQPVSFRSELKNTDRAVPLLSVKFFWGLFEGTRDSRMYPQTAGNANFRGGSKSVTLHQAYFPVWSKPFDYHDNVFQATFWLSKPFRTLGRADSLLIFQAELRGSRLATLYHKGSGSIFMTDTKLRRSRTYKP